MGSTPKNTTTTSTVKVPEFQKPFLEQVLNEARGQYESGSPQYYPGSTVAPLSDTTNQTLGLQKDYALGNPTTQAATGLLGQTLRGDFLGANPYSQGAYDAAASAVTRNFKEAIRPGIDSAFSKAGRLGSTAFQNTIDTGREALGRSLNQLANNFFFNDYNNERTRQQGGLALAPGVNNLSLTDLGLLGRTGAFEDQRSQQLLDSDIQRFNYDENIDRAKLKEYAQLASGLNLGNTTVQQQPVYSNRASQLLGLGLLGSSFIGNPFGFLGSPLLGGGIGSGAQSGALGTLALGGVL